LTQGGDGGVEFGRAGRHADAGGGLEGETSLGVGDGDQPDPLLLAKPGQSMTVEVVGIGQAGIQRPRRCTSDGPVPAEVLDRLGDIVGDHPRRGRGPGSAHSHIRQLAASTISEQVRSIGGGALGPMGDERNSKLVLGVVLGRNAFGAGLFRRNRPPWAGSTDG
jgi:hypothetical protein